MVFYFQFQNNFRKEYIKLEEQYISNPRPLFIPDASIPKDKKAIERLFMGSGSNGIIFDITQRGIEVNGYYEGFNKNVKYSNLRNSVFIPWKEVDKMRQRIKLSGKKNKEVPIFIDESPNEEYLSTLPIVHINGRKFYIDSVRRERRLVDRPQNVYKF